jgi:hypothetical protein
MLLEELLALPVGARVYGFIESVAALPGVVESCHDGAHHIRWADGYVTIPFGRVRDVDEYIAAKTRLAISCCGQELGGIDREGETGDGGVQARIAA